MLPRYMNCYTSSTLPEDSFIGSIFRVNIFITLVFLELIRSPVCAAICSYLVVFSCICLWLCVVGKIQEVHQSVMFWYYVKTVKQIVEILLHLVVIHQSSFMISQAVVRIANQQQTVL